MSVSKVWPLGLVVMLAACTERVNVCDSDQDCKNPAFPFCDVNGEYSESGFTERSCSITPASCPIERCGCTPGASRCDGETLRVCNTDGASEREEVCALGCEPEEMRCLTFDASHGLGAHFDAAADQPAVVVPEGARIDTNTGSVLDSNGVSVSTHSIIITQADGPAIRVFLAKEWTMAAATITGDHAFAVVATGAITLDGIVDASATMGTNGPGARNQPATCAGGAFVSGGGGGGNATPGAIGGDDGNGATAGAGAAQQLGTLVGGCRGGEDLDTNGVATGTGGGGGGAIQLVSRTVVTVGASGLVDVGAGGGAPNAGGGSGGTIVLESPRVVLNGGVFANGGAGGGCGVRGGDALRETASALGTRCGQVNRAGGGAGGSTAAAPTRGGSPAFMFTANEGGGGGAMGRLVTATLSGMYEGTGTVSAAKAQSAINPR